MDDSYQIYYEDTDLVVKRLKHGKLEEFESVGNQPTAKSLHAKTGLFDDLPYDTTRWFLWDDCPTHGWAGWRFPGQGLKYPTCGQFFIMGCLEHSPGYAKKVKLNCARAECPICNKTWLARATGKVVDRISAGLPRRYSKAIHVTVSPPTALWDRFRDKSQYGKIRRKAIKLLKMSGIHGGCLIFHPYRGNDKTGWHYGPHFHTICTGWVKNYDKIKGRLNGWIVKNHRVRKSIGATAYYQLSHAGVRAGNHVVTWYGSMAWNKLKKIPEPPAERPTCPVCGGNLHRVIYLGEGDNPMSDPEIECLEIDSGWWAYGLC